ncbi:MAG: hypothetical protein KJP00_15840, partial [Bacteroidia bacterium]|nr:hypothetical protein [Bacteroidia bacterium]
DKAVGCTTMPILFGVVAAKNIAISVGLLLLLSLGGWLIFQWPMQSLPNKLFILLGLILPLMISLMRLFRARSVVDFRTVSQAIKLLMVNGLIYLFVLRTLIPS